MSLVWDHVPSDPLSNTYAEPEFSPSSSSLGAPTTALEPDTDTLLPNWSPAAAPLAVSLVVWDHAPSDPLSNTYAEPELLPLSSSPNDPAIALAPEIDTLRPNASPNATSLAASLVWDHAPSDPFSIT